MHQRKLGAAAPDGAAVAAAAVTAPAAAAAATAPAAAAAAGPDAAIAKLSRTAKRNAMKRRAAQRKTAEVTPAEAGEKKSKRKEKKSPGASSSADGRLAVLFEDEHVIAINKPPGLLCHPSPGYWDSGTIVHALPNRQRTPHFSPIPDEMMSARLDPTGEDDSFIPRAIVHRLDKGA